MLEKLESIDREILLFINHHNTEWLDSVMWVISSKWFWIPIIALFVALAAVKFAKKCWKPILLACLCFATTDFGSHSVKESVKRYRPTHNLEIADQIHVVNDYRGGMYGFFSGHSANGFGLALLTLLLLRKKWYTVFAIAWVLVVVYSRVYLAVHYPSDIFVGACFGSLTAAFYAFIGRKLRI